MENILVIRFSSLGDVVMASAIVEALCIKFPGSSLTVLTKTAYAPVFEGDTRIERVVSVTGGETPFQIVRMLESHYDAVFDLHGVLRSRIVVGLLKSPLKRMVRKHSLSRRLMVCSRNLYRRKFDALGSYFETLRPLGIDSRILPRLRPNEKAIEAAERLLSEIGSSQGRMIGLAPGSKHPMKRWPEAYWAILADTLLQRGDTPVFIGDGSDKECIDTIYSKMSGKAPSLVGSGLALTIGVIGRLDGMVTNDSGPMHIAGALGRPFAAIFGPTHPDLGFVPGYPNGAILHSGLPCSPCSVHGQTPCRMKERKCMEAVSADMVLRELDSVMTAHTGNDHA
ncbi:MAG: glycosyltransferase family 9 protein [Candidatus Latescibacterota bacterium]